MSDDDDLIERSRNESRLSSEIRGLYANVERTIQTLRDPVETVRHGGKNLLLAKNQRRIYQLAVLRAKHGAEFLNAARQLQLELDALYLANGIPGNVREVGRP